MHAGYLVGGALPEWSRGPLLGKRRGNVSLNSCLFHTCQSHLCPSNIGVRGRSQRLFIDLHSLVDLSHKVREMETQEVPGTCTLAMMANSKAGGKGAAAEIAGKELGTS